MFLYPLVRRVEAPDLSGHGQHTGFFLDAADIFAVGQRIRHRDFDQDRLARLHAGNRLFRMKLRRRGQNDRIHIVARKAGIQRG